MCSVLWMIVLLPTNRLSNMKLKSYGCEFKPSLVNKYTKQFTKKPGRELAKSKFCGHLRKFELQPWLVVENYLSIFFFIREILSVSGGVAISGLELIFILKDTTRRLTRRL